MKNQLTGFQLLTTAFKVLFCNNKPNCPGKTATRFRKTASIIGICIIFGFRVFLQILTKSTRYKKISVNNTLL